MREPVIQCPGALGTGPGRTGSAVSSLRCLFKLKSKQELWLHMETTLGRKLRAGKELESGVLWVELFRQAGLGRDSEEVTFDPSSTRKSAIMFN